MQPRTFPSDVFARLAPDIFLERHLEQGIRPSGRKFTEFRPITEQIGSDGELVAGALGAAVVRSGQSTVVCGITGGLTDFEGEAGVYANVEINRGGRFGHPTTEEQVLSEKLHELIQTANISRENFTLDVETFEPCTKELVLTATIRVLSRSGPCLDLAWAALVAALRDAKIPLFTVDEKTQEIIPTKESKPLELPSTLAASVSTYGITPSGIVLADPDGPAEESCIHSYVSVAKTSTGALAGFSLSTPDADVDEDKIKEMIAQAGTREIIQS